MKGSSEWELIEQCRRGDPAAFEPLVRRHEAFALTLAETLLGSADDAADAVQDAFVKAYRGLGRLRNGSPFGPWFRTILRNECRDRLRSVPRQGAVRWEEETMGAAARVAPTASRNLERDELAHSVRRALARLSPEHREILVMREMEGLGYEEIARETGIPPGTVASRLHHARGLLREIVTAEGISLEGVER